MKKIQTQKSIQKNSATKTAGKKLFFNSFFMMFLLSVFAVLAVGLTLFTSFGAPFILPANYFNSFGASTNTTINLIVNSSSFGATTSTDAIIIKPAPGITGSRYAFVANTTITINDTRYGCSAFWLGQVQAINCSNNTNTIGVSAAFNITFQFQSISASNYTFNVTIVTNQSATGINISSDMNANYTVWYDNTKPELNVENITSNASGAIGIGRGTYGLGTNGSIGSLADNIKINITAFDNVSGINASNVRIYGLNGSSVLMTFVDAVNNMFSVNVSPNQLDCAADNSTRGGCLIRFNATNNAGLYNDSITANLSVDTIVPAVTRVVIQYRSGDTAIQPGFANITFNVTIDGDYLAPADLVPVDIVFMNISNTFNLTTNLTGPYPSGAKICAAASNDIVTFNRTQVNNYTFSCLVNATFLDGTYGINVSVNDSAGNLNKTVFFTFVVDITKPIGAFVTPVGSNMTGNFTVNGTMNDSRSGPRSVMVRLINGTGGNLLGAYNATLDMVNATWNVTIPTRDFPDGTYNLTLNVTDNASNSNESVFIVPMYIDNTAPQISSASVSPGFQTAIISWTTDTLANGTVDYGKTTSYGLTNLETATSYITTHSVTLGGLTGGTTYYYQITVCDNQPVGRSVNCLTQAGSFTTQGTAPSSSSSSSSSSSGGGGGSATLVGESQSTAVQAWTSVQAGTSVSMDITNKDVAITSLTASFKNSVTTPKITVSMLKTKPLTAPELGSKVYQYMQVTPTLFKSEDLSKAVFTLKVTQKWLTDNKLADSDVVVYHLVDKEWKALPTTIKESKNGFVYFTAETPGFSYFVVGAKKVSTPVVSTTPASSPSVAKPVTSAQEKTTPAVVSEVPAEEVAPQETPEEVSTNYGWWIVAVVILVIIVAWLLVGRKRR